MSRKRTKVKRIPHDKRFQRVLRVMSGEEQSGNFTLDESPGLVWGLLLLAIVIGSAGLLTVLESEMPRIQHVLESLSPILRSIGAYFFPLTGK